MCEQLRPRNPRARRPAPKSPAVVEQGPAAQSAADGAAESAVVAKKPAARRRTRKLADTAGEGE